MNRAMLLLFLLCSTPFSLIFPNCDSQVELSQVGLSGVSINQNGLRMLLPVYTSLEALEKSNVSFWQSVPRNFTDHVATIDSRVLAMFVSSNSLRFNLTSDSVGNLWMASDYRLDIGDYINSLTWVSSRTIGENLTSLGFAPFPSNYPDAVKTFLDPGGKIQTGDHAIQNIAANLKHPQNMTQTVRDILDFVNRQGYDREKTRLLLSGNLNKTNILDVFKDAVEVLETNSSICLERSWYAAAILRAAGVPTRTVTDVRLKTWIQVWLPNIGWADAETLCTDPPPHVGMFPRSLFSSVPWMIENSSDASFPFTWLPRARMRVANLTFGDARLFDVNRYSTILSEPIDAELFKTDPPKFSFPIVFEPEIVYAAITKRDGNLTFSLIKGDQNASRQLTLGESNSITLNDIVISFKPVEHQSFLVLQDFTVVEVLRFDIRLLVPIAAVSIILVVFLVYWKARKRS